MANILKVGTMVLVIRGESAGKTAVVIDVDPLAHFGTDHRLEFPAPVKIDIAGTGMGERQSLTGWTFRSWIVPLAPPGEPETLIESTPVRDEVPA